MVYVKSMDCVCEISHVMYLPPPPENVERTIENFISYYYIKDNTIGLYPKDCISLFEYREERLKKILDK